MSLPLHASPAFNALLLASGLLTSGLLVAGCDGCTASPLAGPCEGADAPAGCGTSCDPGSACRGGTYCGLGSVCTADCTPGGGQCTAAATCSSDGRCVPDRDASRVDGAPSDSAPSDGAPRDSTPDAPPVMDACAEVRLETRMVTPTVILIIDQSASMTAGFAGGTRWDVLRDSLLADPDGLIFELQDVVRFGLALYSARSRDGGGGGPPIGECPIITSVDATLGNHGAISGIYRPADPIEDTPTGDAIEAILDGVLAVPDPSPDPTIFILATDGEPDRCEELDPQNGQAEAIAAAERAFGAGIRTFIISVGEGTVSDAHLQDMANAGLGVAPGGADAEFWVAGDDRGLRDALSTIVGGELSCTIELMGRIDESIACSGSVRLNGRNLACDTPNGWRVVDENHIELVGNACDELQRGPGATLEARFPCDVIII